VSAGGSLALERAGGVKSHWARRFRVLAILLGILLVAGVMTAGA
jgi:hypothetical protein